MCECVNVCVFRSVLLCVFLLTRRRFDLGKKFNMIFGKIPLIDRSHPIYIYKKNWFFSPIWMIMMIISKWFIIYSFFLHLKKMYKCSSVWLCVCFFCIYICVICIYLFNSIYIVLWMSVGLWIFLFCYFYFSFNLIQC